MVRLEKSSKLETRPEIKDPQIVNWQAKGKKITVLLDDGREIITPFQLLTKYGILDSDVKPKQLKILWGD